MHNLWRTLRTVLGLYRCFACRRWLVIHDQRELARCENAPLAISLTEVGSAAVSAHERAEGKTLKRVATR
jgi:hypothetical protein